MPTVAIVSRDSTLDLRASRFSLIAAALVREGLTPIPCRYDEADAETFEQAVNGCDAALVWVNPVQDGRFRRDLDTRLRRAAAAGVLVSAHPDVIDRLGVKAVLPRTRELGWSGDAHHYETADRLRAELPERLSGGPRVLKQNRGASGIGVWKVSRIDGETVEVLEAASRTPPRRQPLADFLDARAAEFARVDGFVDQAFQARLPDGMIRCYMSGDRVAGFGWQKVRALLDDQPPPPRTYSGPDDHRFQALRRRMEAEWTPGLIRVLGLQARQLPAIWDADFLFGEGGPLDFVLCEINVSSVHPMPDEAPPAIARTLAGRLAG
jgi:hypothetical protein